MSEQQYPVELQAPDISAYREGNTGVEFINTFDSGKPGSHVMISAVVHGNELCGAITLDFLLREKVRPLQGKLTFAFMNVAAFDSFDTEKPTESRFVEEDFNRVWGMDVLDGTRDSTELRRARAVRGVVDQVDYLLDIHSMQHATVPLMMCGPTVKGRQLARAIGYPADIVSDRGHAAGTRMRDYVGFSDFSSPKNALLVECGQHWAAATAAVAKQTVLRFLRHFAVIDPDFIAAHLDEDDLEPARVIEVTEAVTIVSDKFRFAERYIGMETIPAAGTLIAWDDKDQVTTPFDNCVLIMPNRRLYPGQTAVRLGRIVAAD